MFGFLNYIYNDEEPSNDITKLFNPTSARHLELYHKGVQKGERLREKKEKLDYERLLNEMNLCKNPELSTVKIFLFDYQRLLDDFID